MSRITLLILMLIALPSFAVEPLPQRMRIPGRVDHAFAAPQPEAMRLPTDLAVDSQGRLYVADGANHRIVRFDARGEYLGDWKNIGEAALNRPIGLAVDQQDRLWITDTGHHRIIVADAEGQLIEVIDLPGSENHPADPTDAAVTADGKRTYVIDNENHRLLIRDNSNKTFTIMGQRGNAIGQFQWPFLVDLDEEGTVYISEAIGARVQRLTDGHRWAGQIGRWGVQPGQLYRPKGVAVAPDGRILISDSTLDVIQVFQPRGQLAGVITDEAHRPLRFEHPMGMTFDAQGRLYVVESRRNRVVRVELAEKEQD